MGLLGSLCRIFTAVYLIISIASVLLIPASDAGFLGLEPEPLSSVFAIFLGLPWSTMLGDYASDTSLVWNMFLFILGPAFNVLILILLCRLAHGSSRNR